MISKPFSVRGLLFLAVLLPSIGFLFLFRIISQAQTDPSSLQVPQLHREKDLSMDLRGKKPKPVPQGEARSLLPSSPGKKKVFEKTGPMWFELESLPSDEKVKIYVLDDGPLFVDGHYSVFFRGKATDIGLGKKVTPTASFECRGLGWGTKIKKRVMLPVDHAYRVVVRGSPSLFTVVPSHEDWVGKKVEGGVILRGPGTRPCPLSSSLKWKADKGFPLVRVLFRKRSFLHLHSSGIPQGTYLVCLDRLLEPSEGSILRQTWQTFLFKSLRIEKNFDKDFQCIAGKTVLSLIFKPEPLPGENREREIDLFSFCWDLKGGERKEVNLSKLHPRFSFILDESRYPKKFRGRKGKLLVSNESRWVPDRAFPKNPGESPVVWAVMYRRGFVTRFGIPTRTCSLIWTGDDPSLKVDVSKKNYFIWTKKGWK